MIFIFVLIVGMVAGGTYLALSESGSPEAETEDAVPTEPPQPTIQPTPPPPSPTPTPVLNRLDCEAIRGTQYLSGDERTWFLANCVS